jgi:murein DD-endopeptidase MepM/ murein hydrolase activator NlpD
MSLDLSNISSTFNGASAPSSLDEKNPRSIAAKVQAMFMEVMIQSMEATVGAEDGLFGSSSSSDIYRGMFREQLAAQLSGQLGGPLRQQLEKGMVKDPGDVLKPELAPHIPEAPMLPISGVVTSEMGWRKDPFNGHMALHKGTDIAAKAGTPIQAVADGTVIESGAKGTFGNAVVIQTDDGRRMLYAHNQQNFVRVGDRVVRGDAIAAVGATGRATGPHVHFEVLK